MIILAQSKDFLQSFQISLKYPKIDNDLKFMVKKLSQKENKDKKIKREDEETAIQQIVNHYFFSKGLTLNKIKKDAKKKKIIY